MWKNLLYELVALFYRERVSELLKHFIQVKALYVKNLPKDITQDRLKELFAHHGKITKVVIPPAKPGQERSRYGFVHFAERSSAMKALKNTEKYEIDGLLLSFASFLCISGQQQLKFWLGFSLLKGQVLDCSLAKPQADQKTSGGSNSQKSALNPTYPPHLGYGMVGGAYGALGAGYVPAGFAQVKCNPSLLPTFHIHPAICLFIYFLFTDFFDNEQKEIYCVYWNSREINF